MARKSRMTMLKRQRETKRAGKAAEKRAKRHGIPLAVFTEPKPTVDVSALPTEPNEPDEADPK